MVGGTLMHFRQFFGADRSMNNGVLFRFENGMVDAIHDVVRAVFCRKQGIESRPFPLDCVLQAAVYVVQFFFERIDFFQQIAKLD